MKKQFLDTKEIKDFTKRCLNNESIYDFKGSIDIIKEYWNQAKDVDDFKNMVLSDERLENNQGYWELAKENGNLYEEKLTEYLDKNISDRFITESDMGSLAIGTDDFKYYISNLYGDGYNKVYVTNTDKHLECMDFLTSVEGNFNIYNYDCGNSIAITLHGKYAIYRASQVFVFVKWS